MPPCELNRLLKDRHLGEHPQQMYTGPRGLMDKASIFGTEDCRFESYRGHFFDASVDAAAGGGARHLRQEARLPS